MALRLLKSTVFLILTTLLSCGNQYHNEKNSPQAQEQQSNVQKDTTKQLILGANRTEKYLPLLKNKRVGIVGNPSSLIKKDDLPYGEKRYTHLVDSLLNHKINILKVFSPEHGFRGTADAGETVKDGKDVKTGLPTISLYGKNKKPKAAQLENLDIIVFDIQDVGVRFYTYIATLHYVMEAAAENDIPVILLDRPNPNGHYVDGPIMKKEHTSFLGMHEGIPLVHGMTIGEYAKMMNQEGWLKNSVRCDLTVVSMQHYNHQLPYSLPVRPSPNLPNDQSINLYPSLGLLEGTNLNAGRGTEMQFQILGSPFLDANAYPFTYTPQPNFGSKNPKHKGEKCFGIDLREIPQLAKVDLSYIINAYHAHAKKDTFFNIHNFTAHAGSDILQKQIEQGLSNDEIHATWDEGLKTFKKLRSKYLIYP